MPVSDRLVRAVCAVILFAYAVVILVLALLGVSEGGYHAERYAGRIDPFRVGLLVLIVPGMVLAGLYLAVAIVGMRRRPDRTSLPPVLFGLGFFVATVATVATVLAYPNARNPWRIPEPIGFVLLAGLAIVFLGWLPFAVAGLRDALQRRDRRLLVIVPVVGLLVVAWIIRRP